MAPHSASSETNSAPSRALGPGARSPRGFREFDWVFSGRICSGLFGCVVGFCLETQSQAIILQRSLKKAHPRCGVGLFCFRLVDWMAVSGQTLMFSPFRNQAISLVATWVNWG